MRMSKMNLRVLPNALDYLKMQFGIKHHKAVLRSYLKKIDMYYLLYLFFFVTLPNTLKEFSYA